MSYSKQAIQSADDRIKNNSSHPEPKFRFNKKTKSRQKTPLTTEGFDGYTAKKEIDHTTKEEKLSITHAGGPILNSVQDYRNIQYSYMNPHAQYDEDIIHNWTPHMSLSVVDENSGRPLTAAEINSNQKNSNWFPQYFVNPMQDLDYIVLEALLRFTFAGPLMHAYNKFLVGTGFRPELELINPSGNEEKDRKQIEENQDVIDSLNQIDKQLNEDESDDIDTSFIEKIYALISVTNSFNHGALMFGYDQPIEVDGVQYKEIPSSMKFAHPRDLGIIEAAPDTWRLKSIQWRNAYYMVPAKDMIYLWNPIVSANTRNSWLYGDSMMTPFLDASRVIRKNIGVNFPAMAEATWAGMYVLTVRPQGQSKTQKENEYSDIQSRMVRGAPNILLENPEDVSHYNVDFNPKVKEFQDLTEFLIRYCVASMGLPQTMFYDESQSNRATMIGKIQLATSTVINPARQWIGRMISQQWYQRWFRLIYKDKKPDLYKKFRIKMVFDDIRVEEWFDRIEAVNEIRGPLTDEAYGELAGIEDYQNKIDDSGRFSPNEGSNKSFKFGNEQGEKFEIKKSMKEF